MLEQLINSISVEFTVLVTAAMPIIELKGAIPVGISLGLSPFHSALISFVGSMIPVPFILFTIRPIFNRLKETRTFSRLIHRLTHKSDSKSRRIKKYGA